MKKILTIILSFITFWSFAQMTDTLSYTFQGNHREFKIYVPTTYNANTDTLPMVFFLHGLGGNMNNFSALSYKAEQEKYIMVIPQAIASPVGTAWHSGAGLLSIYPNTNIDDVAFLNSLIDSVSTWYNIDDKRIYSTGFSMGGFMSNRLACELTDRIAAIASVAGTIGNEIKGACNPSKTIPILHIHSTEDEIVTYTGNYGIGADSLVNFWVKHNKCDTIPVVTNLSNVASDGFTTKKYLYKGGNLDSEVEFYKLGGPIHSKSWYNLTSNNDFDAIEVIWDFFKRHHKKSSAPSSPNPVTIENIKEAKIDVYPNPAEDIVQLNFSNEISINTIRILSTLGKTIAQQTFENPINKATFNIRDSSAGVYFFQIEDKKGNTTIFRFYKK